MKLRIKGNSIRLRLTKTEIAEIAAGHEVKEHVSFSAGPKFTYALTPGNAPELQARFDGQALSIQVPLELAKAWATSHDVAMKVEASGELPAVLVEKDFQCLKPRMHQVEDESDLYYNPNEVHGHCT